MCLTICHVCICIPYKVIMPYMASLMYLCSCITMTTLLSISLPSVTRQQHAMCLSTINHVMVIYIFPYDSYCNKFITSKYYAKIGAYWLSLYMWYYTHNCRMLHQVRLFMATCEMLTLMWQNPCKHVCL